MDGELQTNSLIFYYLAAAEPSLKHRPPTPEHMSIRMPLAPFHSPLMSLQS